MVITLSDRASQGVYEDLSGTFLCEYLSKNNFEIVNYQVISDSKSELEKLILANYQNCDLIVTTGGTGLTSRDITVDVIEKIMDYEIRGMSVALHQFNLSKSLGAMFSRALCATKNETMIITLPGSKKAVSEIIEFFTPYLDHGLKHLKNIKVH